jgi:hypothetical protein
MLLNKSFLFGSVVLFTMLFSLAFTGCSSPTDPAPNTDPKSIKITGLPKDTAIAIGLATIKDVNAVPVALGEGKTNADGTAQIPLLKESNEKWTGNGSYYVGIIFGTKAMVSKEKISFISAETTVAYSAFEEVIDVKKGTLTITNIPDTYTDILVTGSGEPTSFMGASLIGGSLPISKGVATATIELLAADDEKLVDFPATGEYALMVFVDSAPFTMTGESLPPTAKTFMGAASFDKQAATVDWKTLIELPSGE